MWKNGACIGEGTGKMCLLKVKYLGHLMCSRRVQAWVEAGSCIRLSILGLQLAIALATVAQTLPLPYLLLGFTIFTHTKPLGCIPSSTERGGIVSTLHNREKKTKRAIAFLYQTLWYTDSARSYQKWTHLTLNSC